MSLSKLPNEILGLISDDLDIQDLAQLYKSSSRYSDLPFDTKKCCILPSKKEIVDFIWNESQLLKYDVSAKYSVFL